MAGAVKIMLSNRSRIPPWPGISCSVILNIMVSLDGRCRQVSQLGNNAPQWHMPAALMTHRTDHRLHLTLQNRLHSRKPRSAAPSTPPTAPSMDFFGLSSGASLCFPKSMPAQYAQVSQPQELSTIQPDQIFPVRHGADLVQIGKHDSPRKKFQKRPP